ncbi:MAG: cbb3-type cytochrome c oxidase N-terminal domain-containing protein [Phycisphaerales bacterium JB063]
MSEQPLHDDSLPKGAEEITGHCYDGIQEYDNPTPAWWTWIFIGSVVFAVIYLFFVFAAGDELSPHGQYRRAYVANVEKKFGELGELEPDAATLIEYMDNEQWMAFAGNVFKTNCIACHGADGEGISGPNLTDHFYKNVTTIEDIARVVRDGAANGAMPPHETRLHPNEIVLVSSYVASLRGKGAQGRPAEGEEAPPWSAE